MDDPVWQHYIICIYTAVCCRYFIFVLSDRSIHNWPHTDDKFRLEGTHRVRNLKPHHSVINNCYCIRRPCSDSDMLQHLINYYYCCCTLTLTLTYQPQNHVTFRISEGHSFFSYASTFSVKTLTLTFDLSTPKPCHF